MILPSPFEDQRESSVVSLSMVFSGPWPSLVPSSDAEEITKAALPVHVPSVTVSASVVPSLSSAKSSKRPSSL